MCLSLIAILFTGTYALFDTLIYSYDKSQLEKMCYNEAKEQKALSYDYKWLRDGCYLYGEYNTELGQLLVTDIIPKRELVQKWVR